MGRLKLHNIKAYPHVWFQLTNCSLPRTKNFSKTMPWFSFLSIIRLIDLFVWEWNSWSHSERYSKLRLIGKFPWKPSKFIGNPIQCGPFILHPQGRLPTIAALSGENEFIADFISCVWSSLLKLASMARHPLCKAFRANQLRLKMRQTISRSPLQTHIEDPKANVYLLPMQ